MRVVAMVAQLIEHDFEISYRVNLKSVLLPLVEKLKDDDPKL